MVSNYDDTRFLLTLQIDHSRVAGLIAAHWGNETFVEPKPYASIVLAAQEHDNGWWEWEVKPSTLNDQGYPLDYHDGSLKYLGKLRLDFYQRGVDRVMQRDPYAGLIVLMHGVALLNAGYGKFKYPPDRSKGNPLVQKYIRDQESLRVKLMEQLRQSEEFREFSTEEHIGTNYKLMEIFDLFGQFVCNRYPFNGTNIRPKGPSTTLNDHPVPVGPGRDEVTLTIDILDEKRAVVRPYPFDVDPLEISIPARLLPRRSYTSEEDILSHFYKGERITINRTLQSH